MKRRLCVLAACVVLSVSLAGCSSTSNAVPRCDSGPRLALVAQSVPGAAYVPCISELAPGWRAGGFHASDGETQFSLSSDRAKGRSVKVVLSPGCDVAGAVPITARGTGVRTYTQVRSVDPRYSGTLYDVFPGGCVTYTFDFQRGPHVELMEQFESAVGLLSRRDLRVQVQRELHVDIGA